MLLDVLVDVGAVTLVGRVQDVKGEVSVGVEETVLVRALLEPPDY